MTHRFFHLTRLARISGFTLATAIILAGCTTNPTLQPAPAANQLSGPSTTGAKASAQGVQVEAMVHAWNGRPKNLAKVQPMLVTIHNHSGQPLRVQYKAFQLISANGARFRALAPLSINKTATVNTDFSPYYSNDFGAFNVAPYWGNYYGGFGTDSGFGYSSGYYNTYNLANIQLPTQDMLARALPEGEMDAGGTAKGFLYFQQLKADTKRVQLRVQLVNANTGKQFGVMSIPFNVGQ